MKHLAGLTLIEVVVSFAVLAVGCLVLLAGTRSSDALAAQARERTHAASAAQAVMEELLADPWQELPARTGQTFPVGFEVAPGRAVQLRPGAGRTAPGRVQVRLLAADLAQVEVSVVWRTQGADGQVALRTLVARH